MCRNYRHLATLIALSGAAGQSRARQKLKEIAKPVILDTDIYLKFFVNTEVDVNVLLRSQKGEGSLEKAINPPFPSTKVHQMSSVGGRIRCGDLVAIPSAHYKKGMS